MPRLLPLFVLLLASCPIVLGTELQKEDSDSFVVRTSRLLSSRVRRLENERTELLQAILQCPPISGRAQTGHLGFHGTPADDQWEQRSLRLDFPTPQTLTTIALVPARVDSTIHSGGDYGFPRRFRIDVSFDGQTFETIADETSKDFPAPGGYPYQVHGEWNDVASVRVVATRLWPIHDRWGWAIGEVMLLSGQRQVGPRARVTADKSYQALSVWSRDDVNDERSILGMPVSHEVSATSGYFARRDNNPAAEKWDCSWKCSFAIAELQVFSGDQNIALGKPVQAKDVVVEDMARGLWAPEYAVDGFSGHYRLLSPATWLKQSGQRQAAEARLAVVTAELANARSHVIAMLTTLRVMVLVALAGWIVFQRAAQVRRTEQLRERIAGDLHDDLGSNLGSIPLTSNLAARDESLPETTRADLQRIGKLASETLHSLRDVVWLIDTKRNRMADLRQHLDEAAGGCWARSPTRSSPTTGTMQQRSRWKREGSVPPSASPMVHLQFCRVKWRRPAVGDRSALLKE